MFENATKRTIRSQCTVQRAADRCKAVSNGIRKITSEQVSETKVGGPGILPLQRSIIDG